MAGPRVREYSEEQRQEFLKLLEDNHGNITKTCKQMGIRGMHRVICEWRKKYPEFDEGVRRTITGLFDDIEEGVMKQARIDGYFPAARFLLMSHPEGRARGYAKRAELAGPDGRGIFSSFADMMESALGGDGDDDAP